MSRQSRSRAFAPRQLDLGTGKESISMSSRDFLSHQTRVLPGRIQNRRLALLFATLQERIDEKVNISRHLALPVIALCLLVYRE